MINVLSVENMRASDAATIAGGISGRELMRRASVAIYEAVDREYGWRNNVVIVCGSGNNAGDGYCLAQILKDNNISCRLILAEDRFSEDGRYYFEGCLARGITVSDGETCDFEKDSIIVDCLYGTGFHGSVRGRAAELIDKINEARIHNKVYVVSVDINSGLNGRNGLADKCVESDLTVSVGDYQPGHFLNMAKDVIGKKINCPIGIEPVMKPYYLFEGKDLERILAKRCNYSNKGSYGYIALIGGSAKYSGAIRLAYLADAAMRSGAGVVSVAIPGAISQTVASHVLESTIYPLMDNEGELVFNREEFTKLISHKKSLAFGMGIGRSDETARALRFLIDNYEGRLVIDADGINDLADMGSDVLINTKAQIVLTPHIKEFSRISSKSIEEIEEDPVGEAMRYAGKYNVVLLLKGPTTIVTDGKEVILIDRGCPGMATAGSGDVLSGIMASVCAYGSGSLVENAAAAAYINGCAGEIAQKECGSISMLASDTAAAIRQVLKEFG